jgi:hypothetical protein
MVSNMQIKLEHHPSEESLERYIMHKANSIELDSIETHILGCPDCVARLEKAEMYIATMRAACRELVQTQTEPETQASWLENLMHWLTPMRLSWSAGLAVLIAALIVVPAQFALRSPVTPTQVNLAAWRGAESMSVPAKRPISVHLNSIDLPDGAVGVQLVDSVGHEVSHGSASIAQESTQVTLPPLQHAGTYFLRLYSVADTKSGQRDLLREFAFQAK